ncbi:MAG: hypothetical protein JSW28_04770 [Thermoplasmata archaeon]|nr:MAG: hypothetical protein JSW28_04770 [Thermoplasmata archaeon]
MTKAKKTPYTCPICETKKYKLLVIMDPLDYGDVKMLLKPEKGSEKGIWFDFDVRERNFYYCKNCHMRFSRIDPTELTKYKEKRIPGKFTECILKECREEYGGRIGNYNDVIVGEIFMKGEGPAVANRRKRIKELLKRAELDEIPDVIDNFLQEFTGEFSLDQAGICNECGIVVVKEVDLH